MCVCVFVCVCGCVCYLGPKESKSGGDSVVPELVGERLKRRRGGWGEGGRDRERQNERSRETEREEMVECAYGGSAGLCFSVWRGGGEGDERGRRGGGEEIHKQALGVKIDPCTPFPTSVSKLASEILGF